MSRSFARSLLAALLGIAGAACGNVVDPFAPGQEAFGVYGVLETALDTQRVRVEPIAPVAPLDTARIRVVLRDADGRAVPMTPRLREGILTYAAPTAVRHGTAYRVDVALDGAVRSVARVTVPPRRRPAFEPVEADTAGRRTLPLRLDGPLDAPTRLEVVYVVQTPQADSAAFPVLYAGGRPVRDGYRYALLFERDRAALLSAFGLPATDTLALRAVRVRVRDDVPERQAAPVESGVGRLLATATSETRLVLPDSVLRTLGFRAP